MKRNGSFLFFGVLILSLVLTPSCSGVAWAKAEFEISMATKMGPQSPEFKAFERFVELVKEKSGGKAEVKIFGSEILGTDETVFKSMNMGAVDLIADTLVLGARVYVPRIDYFTPPFVYDDFEHFVRFLKSEYAQEVFKELEEKAGVIYLNTEWTWRRGPFRVICTKKPLESWDDLKGLKLRFYPSDLEIKVWEYLGTVPTVIAWSETYLALQQGLVESVTAPVTLVNDTKFAEVAPYITKTDEYPQTIAFYMNKNKFFTLPEAIRNVLVEACNEAGAEYVRGLDTTAAAILKEAETEYKATFVDMDRKPLIEKAQGFYEKAEKEKLMPKEFWDVIAAIEAARR